MHPPVLVIDCNNLDSLMKETHAGLAKVFGGMLGRYRLVPIAADGIRVEALVPPAEVTHFKVFLRKILRHRHPTGSGRVPGAGIRVEPSESGLHLLKVFDLRSAPRRSADEGSSFAQRIARGVIGGGHSPVVEQVVEREVFDAVDALCRSDAVPTGTLLVELWDQPQWKPIALALLPRAAARARERLAAVTNRNLAVRAALATGGGTLPPDAWERRVIARWEEASGAQQAPDDSASAASADGSEDRHGTLPPMDLQATLMPAGGHASVSLRTMDAPRVQRKADVPVGREFAIDRDTFGAAVAAIGADPRILPREGSRKAAKVKLLHDGLTIVSCGDAGRYGSGDAGTPLKAGEVLRLPVLLVVSAGTNRVPVGFEFAGVDPR